MIGFAKKLFLILLISFVEHKISFGLSKFFVILPLTFLAYSFYLYKSDVNIGPFEAFFTGLFIDFISGTYLGHNAIFFCFASYLINTYSNAFKLFSYLQICIFFSISASAYVGFSQIIINLYNFSYMTLLVSSIFNFIFCTLVALLSVYFPNTLNDRILK